MDLEVIGRHALLFDDDDMAAFVNSREALVDWNSLSIDRYDVRHLLSSPPPPRNRSRLNRCSPSPSLHGDSLDSEIDHERYLDLPSPSDDEQDLKNEAVEEDAGGYHAVAFSYGAPTESCDQKDFDAESIYRPPFSVPEHLLQNLPPTEKVHQIIARTAMFVNKHGGQSEIVLRVKQGDNPTFGFLLPDHNLHPYFRFLVDHQDLLKSDIDGKSVEEGNSTDGGLNQMAGGGGALSLLGSVYGSGEDEEGTTEDDFALRKNEFEEAANAASITVSHIPEQKNSSSNATGKDKGLSKPPSSLKERTNVITRNRSISKVKPGTMIGSKKDGESMGSLSSTAEKLQPSISASMTKIVPSVLEPPSDMKRVVDKIVEFILRNGREFEAVLVEQDTKYGRFPFLLPSTQYHPYYLKALQKAQEKKLAGKNFTSEKHDSMGDAIEKKSVNKETDIVSLGSDIPHESDRKEKFKMVLGKSKKDDPPSKVTQPQVGVSVDAASAAAILQAARKGLKNPNIEILLKTRNSIGQVPSSEGDDTNWKPDQNEEPGGSVHVDKGIAKTQAVAMSSEANSSELNLTIESKIKAERLKRAKMFAAMIKSGAAPVKSESLRGSSVEPSESGFSASDSHVSHLGRGERESSLVLMEGDTCDTTEKAETKRSTDELNERRSKRSYRSRSKKGEEGEGEDEEGEDAIGYKDNKHSRKKRRSHHSSHYSRDKHSKHRHKHDSSSDDDLRRTRHKHRCRSSSNDEQRRSRHKHRHDSSADDEQRRSRHKHRHDSSSEDDPRHSRRRHRHDISPNEHGRHRHKHNGSSDDEQMHSHYNHRNDSSDDEHRHPRHGHKHCISSDEDNPHQAKSEKRRKASHSEREAELEEGEIITKSDQSKVSEGGDGASREPSVDLSKSTRRSESADVSNDLRAKIRAMLMATL